MMDSPICPVAMAYCFASQAVHLRSRLAAYEDTGLMPEEVKEHEAAYIEIMTRTYTSRRMGGIEMLDLTIGGQCIGGEDAVRFFEAVPDMLSEAVKTEDFCSEYERALNRLRFEIRKSAPTVPKVQKERYTTYNCGQCGSCLDRSIYMFCPSCGRSVDWSGL